MINQLTFFFYHYDYYIVITVRMIVKIDFYFFQCRTLIPKMQFVKFLKILHIIVIEIIFCRDFRYENGVIFATLWLWIQIM